VLSLHDNSRSECAGPFGHSFRAPYARRYCRPILSEESKPCQESAGMFRTCNLAYLVRHDTLFDGLHLGADSRCRPARDARRLWAIPASASTAKCGWIKRLAASSKPNGQRYAPRLPRGLLCRLVTWNTKTSRPELSKNFPPASPEFGAILASR